MSTETKHLNMPMEIERHKDLELIQESFSRERGTKLTKAQTVKILFFETANRIRNDATARKELDN